MAQLLFDLLDESDSIERDFWRIPFLFLGVSDCNAHVYSNFSEASMKLDILSEVNSKTSTFYGGPLVEMYVSVMASLWNVLKQAESDRNSMHIHVDENMLLSKVSDNRQLDAVKKLTTLLSELKDGKHSECLKKLSSLKLGEATDEVNEASIQAVFAHHVFEPLVSNGDVIVDSQCFKAGDKNLKRKTICPFCEANVQQENTNFGCKDLWHGRADIVVRKNGKFAHAVKVSSNLDKQDHDDDEPEVKYFKADSDDLELYSLTELNSCSDCDISRNIKNKDFKQAISQTIINSFLSNKLHQGSEKRLIPSFLVCNDQIFINFYNVTHDILYVQSKPMYLFIGKDQKLNVELFFSIWLALNSDVFSCDNQKKFFESAPKSGCKLFLEEHGLFTKYLNEVESGFLRAQENSDVETHCHYIVRPERTNSLIAQIYQN